MCVCAMKGESSLVAVVVDCNSSSSYTYFSATIWLEHKSDLSFGTILIQVNLA